MPAASCSTLLATCPPASWYSCLPTPWHGGAGASLPVVALEPRTISGRRQTCGWGLTRSRAARRVRAKPSVHRVGPRPVRAAQQRALVRRVGLQAVHEQSRASFAARGGGGCVVDVWQGAKGLGATRRDGRLLA